MTCLPRVALLVVSLAVAGLGACTQVNPVTLGQRAVEDRSAGDIAKDTEIFSRANAAMAGNKTFAISTLIYEQELVAYGLIDDRAKMEAVESAFRDIEGVRQLHWHVAYMTPEERERRKASILNVAQTTRIQGEIEANWIEAEGVKSPNFRVGVDPLGHAILLGRARSEAEEKKVIDIVRGIKGVRQVTEYIYAKP